jgi:ribosomal protein S18 acetylase RimI-like enzyme
MQSQPIHGADIEAIERATLAAVAPQAVEEIDGWLLPFDGGTIGRAKSAVPLRHTLDGASEGAGAARLIEAIERRYAAQNQPTMLRLPDRPGFDPFKQILRQRGYQSGRATQVQVGATAKVLQVTDQPHADLDSRPDPAWAALFLGEGFDPVDGASRVLSLSRAAGTLFASVRENGRTVAAGAGAFSHGWASLHGMRTERAKRGRGLAARVLAALAQAALERGAGHMFLQVEQGNLAALALYRRAGFETAWCYDYWSRHER